MKAILFLISILTYLYATSATMQLNLYSDTDCQNYIGSKYVSESEPTNNCHTESLDWAQPVKMASYYFGASFITFYSKDNCADQYAYTAASCEDRWECIDLSGGNIQRWSSGAERWYPRR